MCLVTGQYAVFPQLTLTESNSYSQSLALNDRRWLGWYKSRQRANVRGKSRWMSLHTVGAWRRHNSCSPEANMTELHGWIRSCHQWRYLPTNHTECQIAFLRVDPLCMTPWLKGQQKFTEGTKMPLNKVTHITGLDSSAQPGLPCLAPIRKLIDGKF